MTQKIVLTLRICCAYLLPAVTVQSKMYGLCASLTSFAFFVFQNYRRRLNIVVSSQICAQHANSSNAVFKDALTEAVWSKIGPVSAEIARIRKEPAFVDQVLREGADRAREISVDTMKQVRAVIGLE
jgi:hypothetical protein